MKRQGPLWLLLASMVISPSKADEIAMPPAPDDPAMTLPAAEGGYRVGVRGFSWIDSSRTQTGRAGDGGEREITATAWYPATIRGEGRAALYFPTLESMLSGVDALPAEQARYVGLHAPLRNVATNAVPAAAPLAVDGGWPIVLFSPGGNVSSHAQTALAERIASRGYVFVSLSHPYSTIDVAPGTGFSMSRDWDLDNADRNIADRNDNELAGILAADASFALDRLRLLAAEGHELGTVMDFRKVAIAGHSRGGKTVGRACSSDDSYKACVVMDNIGPAKERTTGIEQPFMTLRAPWGEERVAELHDYLGRTGSVSFDVELSGSNHFSCSDLPIFIADIRVEGRSPVDGIDACADVVSAFLDAFLKGGADDDTDWLPDDRKEQVSLKAFARPDAP